MQRRSQSVNSVRPLAIGVVNYQDISRNSCNCAWSSVRGIDQEFQYKCSLLLNVKIRLCEYVVNWSSERQKYFDLISFFLNISKLRLIHTYPCLSPFIEQRLTHYFFTNFKCILWNSTQNVTRKILNTKLKIQEFLDLRVHPLKR